MWCYSGALCCNVIESVTSSRHLLTEWTKIPRCRGLKMKAGYLLWRQAYFWFRDWNEKRAETGEKKILKGILKRWHHWSHSTWGPGFISAVRNDWTLSIAWSWVQIKVRILHAGKSSMFIIHQARFAMKDLPFAPHFPLQGEGISCSAVVSNIELWVRCSSARLCKIRL